MTLTMRQLEILEHCNTSGVSLEEFAEAHEISVRTMQRELSALKEFGAVIEFERVNYNETFGYRHILVNFADFEEILLRFRELKSSFERYRQVKTPASKAPSWW